MFDTNPVYGLYTAIHEICHIRQFNHTNAFRELVDDELKLWDITCKYAKVYPYEYYYKGELCCGPQGGLPTQFFNLGEFVIINHVNVDLPAYVYKRNKMTLGVSIMSKKDNINLSFSPSVIKKKSKYEQRTNEPKSLCKELHGEVYDGKDA